MRRLRSSTVGTLGGTVLALWMATATARADEPTPMPARVAVQPPGCELTVEEIVRLLRIELTGDGVSDVSISSSDGEHALGEEDSDTTAAIVRLEAIPCEPSAVELAVTIDNLVTHKQVRRVLSTSGLPEATRARAIALGIAELLRSSWAELSLADVQSSPLAAWLRTRLRIELTDRSRAADTESTEALATPEPTPTPVDKPTARVPALLGAATLALTAMPSGGSASIGGALDGAFRLLVDAFALRVEIAAQLGRAEARLGGVDLGMATLALIPELRSPMGPALFAVGPSVTLGVGWASGQPDPGIDASSGAELIVSAGAEVRVLFPLTSQLWGTFGLSGGYMVRGLSTVVDAAPDGGLVGPYVALRVGIALSSRGS